MATGVPVSDDLSKSFKQELEACKMKIDELNMKGKIAESERDSLARQVEGGGSGHIGVPD